MLSIDPIVHVTVTASSAAASPTVFDTPLLLAPLPEAAFREELRLISFESAARAAEELSALGFAEDSVPVQTARKVFGASPAPSRLLCSLYPAEPETPAEALEAVLERTSAFYGLCLAGEETPEGPAEELRRDYGPKGITEIREGAELPADLRRQKQEAENRKIRLPHGGNIVIDRCEALTAIDVNSASDPGEGNRRETVIRTNLEACREIMIQARLRNLSGILILDMIDMDDEKDRSLILEALKDAFREDRIKTVIHGYTSLGLIEMTRKRSRATWPEQQRT